ncbi:hypothetical protein KGF56_003727 [Candida oxycetoniae]|uniref:Uncharacterized protein n=1 Tax=Candida oxycetoniae TaxID=497107 RepID=A0AAI9WWW6_9ASCO|nr:uncharacterized protein KGF56_003727 [Candida oxycetoniae]KAI3403443.2 hypothetical protein KGF56_003727 [Candida oxycetoniae]
MFKRHKLTSSLGLSRKNEDLSASSGRSGSSPAGDNSISSPPPSSSLFSSSSPSNSESLGRRAGHESNVLEDNCRQIGSGTLQGQLGSSIDIAAAATAEDQYSTVLSETDTLIPKYSDSYELQPRFVDNFAFYLPFIIRQWLLTEVARREEQSRSRREEQSRSRRGASVSREVAVAQFFPFHDSYNIDNVDDGDVATIFNEEYIPLEQQAIEHDKIMDKKLTAFNYKRSLVIVNGMSLKSNTFIFPTSESFELFKKLRGKVISSVDSSIKKSALPLFKMSVPYFSTFRKDSPFITFRKYREIPPSLQGDRSQTNANINIATANHQPTEEFELYDYCHIHSKYFRHFRRFIYEFMPNTPHCFKVVSFQSYSLPLTDFLYKNTRFRLIGTSMANGLICHYSPQMKLFILDNDQVSLCDDLYNKPITSASTLLHLKKDAKKEKLVEFDCNDASCFINPVPSKTNDFAYTRSGPNYPPESSKQGPIPFDLPPFGIYKDSSMYLSNDMFNLPKKYTEIGKIDLYQDIQGQNSQVDPILSNNSNNASDALSISDVNSTFSVDTDTMVLTVILTTMREVNIRNSGKSNATPGFGSHGTSISRMGGLGMWGNGIAGITI